MVATDYPLGAAASTETIAAGAGRVARYARGDDYHDLLRGRLNSLASWLEARVCGRRQRLLVQDDHLEEGEKARHLVMID